MTSAELPEDLGETYPVCLDLFCGIGGVARTLTSYGARPVWDVVGVDLDGSKAEKYPGLLVEWDLRDGLPAELESITFDVAWASPPCTPHTKIEAFRSGENLIPLARDLLENVDAELTILENVERASHLLRDPVVLEGGAFGLEVEKRRVFETSFPVESQRAPGASYEFSLGDREHPVEGYREAHGFDARSDLTAKELREAIPPAYVEHLIDEGAPQQRDQQTALAAF